ncbi:MAG: hypothetical protein U1F45_03050 [Burkholderiales bacterium]
MVRIVPLACLAVAALAAHAQPAAPLRLADTWPLPEHELPYAGAAPATHRLQLDLVAFVDTTWKPEAIVTAVRAAGALLAQCGIRLERAELYRFEGGDPGYRYLWTPVSRELVRRVRPAKPALFFVRDSRHVPTFDAEAFGTGNSATRPELAFTVWVTAYVRDLPVALAHELAHVLMDSGAHSVEPGNLMRDRTAPENATLAPAQCARMVEAGERNGLLQREPAR